MKRRSFYVFMWLLVASSMGVNAATNLTAGDTAGYVYGLVTVVNIALACIYWFHPEPIERPDEPVPRRWSELGGLAAAILVVSGLVLYVALG